jgi:Tol biopolymer transport system component
MRVAVTATTDPGGVFKALVMRYDMPGMVALTEGATSSRYPRWGPGGNRVAFAREANESEAELAAGELVVRDIPLAEAQGTVLADGGTGNTLSFRYMEWEPGNSILYVRRTATGTSGISVVPTDGGTVTSATEAGTFPDWSSDGMTFAFSAAGSGLLTSSVGGTPAPIDMSGSTAEQPHFNRANNQLLFLRSTEARPAGFNTSLFLVPVTGGGMVQTIADFTTDPVTGGSIDSYVANPVWAPDGMSVAYVRAYFSNADPLTPGGPRPEPVLCGNPTATLCPTRAGNVIYVRRINPQTGAGVEAEFSFAEEATLPSFSPDGRFLAYVKGGELYVQQIDPATGRAVAGVNPIRHPKQGYTIQTGAGDDHRPRWQPK